MYAFNPCCLRRRVQDDGRRPQHCWMSDARGRLCHFVRVWQMSVPAILLMPKGMRGVLPCSPGTVKTGARNTVDAQRHGGPYRMRVNGAHNIVGKISAPTTLFVSGRLQSIVSVGVQGMVPGIMV